MTHLPRRSVILGLPALSFAGMARAAGDAPILLRDLYNKDLSFSALAESKKDQRITVDGVIVIKAQQYRTQEQNRADALERLRALILSAIKVEKARRPTKPTLGSKKRRLEGKNQRAAIKAARGKVDY